MIDAHIHLDDKRFDEDRTELIQQAQNAGITQFISPTVAVDGFRKLKKLSTQYPCLVPSYGLHPYSIDRHQKNDIEILDFWLSNNKSCALGECGLDFSLKHLDKNIQQFYFEAQIELAKKHKLPLILHARGAVDAVFAGLKNTDYFNAMIHSYNGSIEQTRQLLDKGVKFSFGGAICNPKAHKLHKLIKFCPIDSIMFETDAPDQSPYPHNKHMNIPLNLVQILEFYSELTKLSIEKVAIKSSKVTMDYLKINEQ